MRAGDQVGCDLVEELTLAAPLVLPERRRRPGAGPRLPDDAGRRPVTRLLPAGPRGRRCPWTEHATGMLAAGARTARSTPRVWPPAGAEPVDVDGMLRAVRRPGLRRTGRCSRGCGPCGAAATRCSPRSRCPTTSTPRRVRPAPGAARRRLHAPPDRRRRRRRGGVPFAWNGSPCHRRGRLGRAGAAVAPTARTRCRSRSPTPTGARSPRSTRWPSGRCPPEQLTASPRRTRCTAWSGYQQTEQPSQAGEPARVAEDVTWWDRGPRDGAGRRGPGLRGVRNGRG